jgi:hypothetical protein
MPRPGFKKRWRHALGVIALLLIGMAINVAVAWVCIWRHWEDLNFRPLQMQRAAPGEVVGWLWTPPRDLPVTEFKEQRSRGMCFREVYHMVSRPNGPGEWDSRSTVQGQQLFRAGWPWLSLEWTDSTDGVHMEQPAPRIAAGSVTLQSWSRGLMVLMSPTKQVPYAHVMWLPVVPSGVGFVGNTLVYAGASWIVWALAVLMPRRLRRRWRRRRSCCERCGYGIAGMDRCPECGANP